MILPGDDVIYIGSCFQKKIKRILWEKSGNKITKTTRVLIILYILLWHKAFTVFFMHKRQEVSNNYRKRDRTHTTRILCSGSRHWDVQEHFFPQSWEFKEKSIHMSAPTESFWITNRCYFLFPILLLTNRFYSNHL